MEKGKFKKVNLFTGIIFNRSVDLTVVLKKMVEKFSAVDLKSDKLNFDFTDYYYSEMGDPLFRMFVSFKELIDPENLPEIKIQSNELEKEFAISGNRQVNIDPGYISDANVIIATTKNHYHRVPLKDGIYAHIEYVLKGKNLHFLEWTYPDFKSISYLDFFNKLIELYKNKKKGTKIQGRKK